MVPFLRTRPAVPVLGVCLGHQAWAVAAGGKVAQTAPLHGRSSRLTHDGDAAFDGLPRSFHAARYHSLAVTELPASFRAVARGEDGLVMAMRHRELPQLGLQFHPESVLTPFGNRILANVLEQAIDTSASPT